MEEHEFQQAKVFIFADIQREIELAKASENILRRKILRWIGIRPGGGNFLAALGLLAYTEFAGRIMNDDFSNENAGQNFRDFLRMMGDQYEEFDQEHDVYGKFRCNMVHQYYLSECDIFMAASSEYSEIGIGKHHKHGKFFFIVEKYFRDFSVAFEMLESDVTGL